MDTTDIAALSAGFIQDAAVRHLLFVLMAIFILFGAVSLLIAFSEKAFGFSTRGAVDELERLLHEGQPTAIAVVGALMAIVIFCGAWIAVTVIRP